GIARDGRDLGGPAVIGEDLAGQLAHVGEGGGQIELRVETPRLVPGDEDPAGIAVPGDRQIRTRRPGIGTDAWFRLDSGGHPVPSTDPANGQPDGDRAVYLGWLTRGAQR